MISTLNFTVAMNGQRSFLKDAYVTQPFRIIPVGQHKSDAHAYLMIMSSSPGILSGDAYEYSIRVKENARLQLQSQSYQRLFHMEASATQKMQITLEKGSSFFFVPHPVVPHKNSRFTSLNRIDMAEGCQLLMSEIITCGRKHHGEVFEFTSFHNFFEVFHNGRLVLKDNILLQPKENDLQAMGMLETYTHQGTLIYSATAGIPSAPGLADQVQELLEQEADILGGVSRLQHNGLVVRVLGHGGEQLFTLFQNIQERIWNILG
ncbi:urease accessory protein UreD [Niabella drilacis]|nr:urease accessory protein UreD [Niabella drilacis]